MARNKLFPTTLTGRALLRGAVDFFQASLPVETAEKIMGLMAHIKSATAKPWASLYLRILACILLFGGFVHIGNIAGWNGKPWNEFPDLWRFMDIILLIFNIGVAIGLFFKSPVAIVVMVAGLGLLQFIPFTFFRSHFVTRPEDHVILNGMLGMEVVLLLILFMLIYFKK